MTDPCRMTVEELQHAIQAGALTRVQVAETHLQRIDAVNPLTNTYVELRADAVLAEAGQADARFGTAIAGPLDGAMLTVKDSFCVAGLRRTDGLKVNADRIADKDDVVVQRLRSAGAFVLGHANVPDLCIRWNTISGLYGASRNPRDLSLSVGGSSGGDAGNIAGGMATVGIGQDLNGSIRVPAGFCGIYGLRPGAGVVPMSSHIPAVPSSPAIEAMASSGPMGRTVDDVARTFHAMAGPHRSDPASLPVTLAPSSDKPRIAVLRDQTGALVDNEILRRLDATRDMLREAGYEVVEDVVPDMRRAPDLWAEINATDLFQIALPAVGEFLLESGRQHIEEKYRAYNLGNQHEAYYRAWLERRNLQEQVHDFMHDYPLILAPVAGMPTPPLDFDHMLEGDAMKRLVDQMRCVGWVNLFGLPSLALPNGIQIVGRRFLEEDILAAAAAIEPMLPEVEIATPG